MPEQVLEVLAVFLARMAAGYALCLGLVGPQVAQGPWRRISLFVIAGLSVVALAAGGPGVACLSLGLAAVFLERALAFGRLSPLCILPFGLWLPIAAEGWPPGIDTYPSAIAAGGTLGAMLLGHSYLVARGLGFGPLKRMARILLAILVLRAVFVTPAFFGPAIEMMDWVFLLMRASLGLLLPLVLGWMVIQCTKIESNQSATGILYGMTVLVCMFGELIAVYLKLARGIAA